MKKVLRLFVVIFIASLCYFSLSFADYENYAVPQLEWITNAFPGLWDKPKTEVLRMMAMFPDFECTDYDDQIGCFSKFNTNSNDNIYITYFMDDYEEHHDNLWKAAVTVDMQDAEQQQGLLHLFWLEGLEPFHTDEDDFAFLGAIPLYFTNDTTKMIAYAQLVRTQKYPFLLVEYLNKNTP